MMMMLLLRTPYPKGEFLLDISRMRCKGAVDVGRPRTMVGVGLGVVACLQGEEEQRPRKRMQGSGRVRRGILFPLVRSTTTFPLLDILLPVLTLYARLKETPLCLTSLLDCPQFTSSGPRCSPAILTSPRSPGPGTSLPSTQWTLPRRLRPALVRCRSP